MNNGYLRFLSLNYKKVKSFEICELKPSTTPMFFMDLEHDFIHEPEPPLTMLTIGRQRNR